MKYGFKSNGFLLQFLICNSSFFKHIWLKSFKAQMSKLIYNKKATGFKSLRINYWKINQVTLKCQTDFLYKTCKRGLTQKKNITIEFYIFE